MPPGRIPGLAEPDLRLQTVRGQHRADVAEHLRPRPAAEIPGAGKAVHADRVDVRQRPTLRHQRQPVRIGRAHAAEQGLLAQLVRPVRGLADHLGEALPVVVQVPVPVVEVVRLVPQFDPLEAGAEATHHLVDEIGEGLAVARRRRRARLQPQRWRGVAEARQHLAVGAQQRHQPGVPALAFGGVPVGPGELGAQPAHAELAHVAQQRMHRILVADAQPFDQADLGQPFACLCAHPCNPRRASSALAASTPSAAVCSRSHSTSSSRPCCRSTCGA
ncbi:hypothetical protein NB689_002183 [Xanthomonas sacchari]|nr:hypothetical protein [Xanthomonas sacchari]MCW0465505.1 hypothetical protein [Xanthomonas sacchari]